MVSGKYEGHTWDGSSPICSHTTSCMIYILNDADQPVPFLDWVENSWDWFHSPPSHGHTVVVLHRITVIAHAGPTESHAKSHKKTIVIYCGAIMLSCLIVQLSWLCHINIHLHMEYMLSMYFMSMWMPSASETCQTKYRAFYVMQAETATRSFVAPMIISTIF